MNADHGRDTGLSAESNPDLSRNSCVPVIGPRNVRLSRRSRVAEARRSSREDHLKVTHDGRRLTNRRIHVGRSRLGVACRQRAARTGRIVKDLVVMLADGGDCVADLAAFATRAPGSLGASDSTAFRVIHRIASDPQALGGVMKEGSLLGREVGATGTRRGAVPRRGRHHNCNARGAAPTVRRTGPMHSHELRRRDLLSADLRVGPRRPRTPTDSGCGCGCRCPGTRRSCSPCR